MPAISLWLFLYLPLQILACMRTPIIDEQPAIPVTLPPVTVAPDPCEPVCEEIETNAVNGINAPVLNPVAGDCTSIYATCDFPDPSSTAIIDFCDPVQDLCGSISQHSGGASSRGVGILLTCDQTTKMWEIGDFYSVKNMSCRINPGPAFIFMCVTPPPISGTPLPLLTLIPDPDSINSYIVTCVFPEGTTAAIDLYDENGIVYKTFSYPSVNTVSTQIACTGSAVWHSLDDFQDPISDIKCRAI